MFEDRPKKAGKFKVLEVKADDFTELLLHLEDGWLVAWAVERNKVFYFIIGKLT